MAEVVTFGTSEELSQLRDKIYYKTSQVQEFHVNLQLASKGKLTVLECDLPRTSDDYERNFYSKRHLVNAISELILTYWEGKLINDIIKENFYFFKPEEKEKIISRSKEIIQTGHPTKYKTLVYEINRKTKIINKLSEYLELNKELNIEGFVKFRLKDYVKELNEAVNYAVDEYMMEKEYKEFIRLLRYFVEIQEPRLNQVHVVVKGAAKFKLFDDKQEEISNEYLDDFFSDLIDTDINYEDLLISALITIAPKQLTIHMPNQDEDGDTIKTIRQIFSDRLTNCDGCHWCNQLP
ncbi:MAG: putative sporulation protein YtxC [Bacillota bacterium]|nr:putative sporulation protein YtxC [Bacillota bacterium]